jgi:hypothetical protein
MLVFLHQMKKQSLLGNLVQADTGLFVPFATFCENCIGENSARPAVTPHPEVPIQAVIL